MKINVDTIRSHSLELSKKDLIDILNASSKLDDIAIPPDAAIFLEVPSGGDYSGTELHMDRNVPLQLTWSTKS